jgi:putative membrane protein
MQWIKVLHLLGIVLWMGGVLLLTQIFRRHLEEEPRVQERFALLEKRLFQSAANPGAAVVLITGILMILLDPATYLRAGWFHTKLLLAIALFILHIRLLRRMALLHKSPQQLAPKEFALLHGIGALLLTLALIMVLVQPF